MTSFSLGVLSLIFPLQTIPLGSSWEPRREARCMPLQAYSTVLQQSNASGLLVHQRNLLLDLCYLLIVAGAVWTSIDSDTLIAHGFPKAEQWIPEGRKEPRLRRDWGKKRKDTGSSWGPKNMLHGLLHQKEPYKKEVSHSETVLKNLEARTRE